VTETAHRTRLPNVLQALKVWSKTVSKEWQFNLQDKTVFRPSLACHCRRMTDTAHRTHHGHVLQILQVWSITVSKEWQFILEDKTVFRPCLACHCKRTTETAHRTHCPRFRSSASLVENGHYRRALYSCGRNFFVPISPPIAEI
jgi:hypothetical protein